MKRIVVGLTAMILALTLARAAHADVLTLGPQNFDITSAQTSAGLTFQQFNPSLGTLTAVNFNFIENVGAFQLQINNTSSSAQAGGVGVTLGYGVLAPNLAAPLTTNINPGAIFLSPGSSATQPVSAFTGNGPESPSALSGYTGTGTYSASVQRTITLNPTFFPGGGVVVTNTVPDTPGSVSVSYVYTAATPEPASLVLLGTSVAGLAAAAWRRRRLTLAL